MYPVLIDWGFLFIPAWHFFYVLGALFAYRLLLLLAKWYEPGIPPQFLTKLFVCCYVSGYFGSRLMSILVEESEAFQHSNSFASILAILIEMLFTFGPMTFYGGALLAGFVGWAVTQKNQMPLSRVFDLAIPSGFLALVFGRIGCFLNGDDYGKAIDPRSDGSYPFWAVNFPNLGDNIYRWPVQLIESISVLLLLLIVLWNYRNLQRHLFPGAVAYAMTMGYAELRLFNEFLRDDFRGSVFFSWLSTSQFISVILIVCGALAAPFFILRHRKNLQL